MVQIVFIGSRSLYLPNDHDLIEIQRQNRGYDRAYAPILRSICEHRPAGCLIDIGANIGDTAAYWRTHVTNPILCVEGAPGYLPYLRLNKPELEPDVGVIEAFVMPRALRGRAVGFVEERGTGQFRVGAQELDGAEIAVDDLLERARCLGDGQITLLKTDTDGLDAFIVDDALAADYAAPLFFECDYIRTLELGDPEIWRRLFARLESEGWSTIIFDNHGRPMGCFDRHPAAFMNDLHGWVHLQHQLGNVGVHYFDVWAFPPDWSGVYDRAAAALRARLLKPYAHG